MTPCFEAYLDIETTGLSPWDSKITVIGIYLCKGEDEKFIQLVGDEATANKILEILEGVDVIHTYNGSRFDLPFIDYKVGVNLAELFKHCDLMYDCWNRNLYGGFKSVERQLGIERRLIEVDGHEAVRLWWRYVNDYDEEALKTLLEYNKEDVFNLKRLKEKLLGSNS
ncbi:MAG: ribonuclease H-like domain-containing protein [Dehalococcoidia bacterium]|nr:MAG: ribonuclease H-like domain-containing protein [Dehalococcoidia bacterium]